ncbi:MAG: inositol monophosphatase family protein [Paracoccaceae bacterium]|nr:MAG: inositol monophosphatase family protein [Paracoccaceae bacterium]
MRADAQDLIDTAAALAGAARAATLRHFRADGLTADTKEDDRFDPVTVADRECEAAMRAVLAARRPQDAILGEEFAGVSGTSGLTWVLDPIDGTRGYLSGTPTWGVLIAACDETGPIYGVIDQPYIGERFEGGLGRAQVTGPMGTHPLRARAPRGLSQAILFSTFPEVGTVAEHAAFRRVAGAARLVRYGMDCYGYALVAAGQIDLVIEAGLQAYDVCAPIAVIEAAGGIVTDWQGRPCHGGGQVLAAANAAIHAEALALLAAG